VNGSLTGFFNSSHFLRQEDSLFPLLLVTMEALSKMIFATVNRIFFIRLFLWGLRMLVGLTSPLPFFVCGLHFDILRSKPRLPSLFALLVHIFRNCLTFDD
jgi:hypothetical protein